MSHFLVYVIKYGACFLFGLNMPLDTKGVIIAGCALVYGAACTAEEKLKHV